MAKQIVPSEFKTHLLEQLIESVTEPANTAYYAFLGDHISTGDTAEDVSQPTASYRDLSVDNFRNMIFGKRLQGDEFRLVVRRYNWVANTVYTMYDDQDDNLFDKNFYVVVDENAFKHVYKCLYNANNIPSISRPVFADVSYDANLFETGDNYYETADGYQWKYLYSINSDIFRDFASQEYIPVIANTTVQDNAINGSIDVIKVDSHGKNYNNYITGAQFTESDIQVSNTSTYRLPDGASTVENFYANTIIQLTSGTGSGQFKRVVSSRDNGQGVIITTGGVDLTDANTFATTPDSTSTYDISPEVRIISTGTQSVNAFARAIVNANASNSIHRVEMLNPGKDYTYAVSEVLIGAAAGPGGSASGERIVPLSANVRPIISPSGGHGANSAIELGSKAIAFSATFRRNEDGAVLPENTFGTFGIIRDPLFANIEFNFEKTSIANTPGSDGTFVENEKILQFKKIKIDCNVSVDEGNTVVSSNCNIKYDEYFERGDYVFIRSDTVASHNFIAQINAVTNSSSFTVDSALNFTSSNADLYTVKVISNATIDDVFSDSKIFTRNCVPKFEMGEWIIGTTTYAVANVVGIDVNNRFDTDESQYDFSVYNQMVRCVGEFQSGRFINDEQVYQGSSLSQSTANAYVHSSNSSHVFLTNVIGRFNTNTAIIGATSDAVFGSPGTPKFTKYEGDLDSTKGNIIYVQNDVPVTRFESQSEQIRIILEL